MLGVSSLQFWKSKIFAKSNSGTIGFDEIYDKTFEDLAQNTSESVRPRRDFKE